WASKPRGLEPVAVDRPACCGRYRWYGNYLRNNYRCHFRRAGASPTARIRELGPVDLHLKRWSDQRVPAQDHTLWRVDHPVHHARATRTVWPVAARAQLLQGLAVLVLTEKLNTVH